MKALVGAFSQEKARVGAFSVIVQLRRLIFCSTSKNLARSRYSAVLHRDCLVRPGPGLHYRHLDWRLEAGLATRAARDRCEPRVTMR